MTKIVVVAIPHPTEPNLFLHGLRRDNGKWALPGGHVNPGETLIEGARREAREEAGLDLKQMEECRNGCFGENDVTLFTHPCPENLDLDSSEDPDKEFLTFKWLDPSFSRNMHVPGHKNILVEHISETKKGLAGDWQKEGYTLRHEHYQDDNGGTVEPHLRITAHDKNGNMVGSARFQIWDKSLYPVGPAVSPDHARKGLATAMYAHAEKIAGKKVVQSDTQTDEAKALWNQPARPFGKSEQLQRHSKMTVEPFLDHEKFDPRKHDFIVRTNHVDGTKSFAAFTHKGKNIMPFNMEVHADHRRQGHASNMLRHAQIVSRKTVMQSPDMTSDAQKFAKTFFKKSELSGDSGEFIVEIDLPIEEDLIKSYFSPDKEGDVHPEKGYVAVRHPLAGKLFWHQHPEVANSHDSHIKHNSENFLNSIQSPIHREAMRTVIKQVAKDPHRHFIPTEENGIQRLRARHIKSLILGGNDVTLDTSDPNALRIKRQSHSTYGNYKPIVFKLAIGGKRDAQKSERDDGPGITGSSEKRWIRSAVDILRRRYGRSLEKNWPFDTERSGFRDDIAKSVSDDYKSKAANNAILMYPVTVNGSSSLGDNIPMHMTVKDFGNRANLSDQAMQKIHSTIDSLPFHHPINTDKMRFVPYRFRNVKGELQHVLLVSDLPQHVTSVYDQTQDFGPKVQNYLHHIRIDDNMYKDLKQKGSVLTGKDVNVQFHPPEFREGAKVVKVYKP